MADFGAWLDLLGTLRPKDEEVRRRFAWYKGPADNPVEAAGNVLGAAGTFGELLSDEYIKPIAGAGMALRDWSARQGAQVQGIGPGQAPIGANLDQPLPQLTREDLTRYAEEQAGRQWGGTFALEAATDPWNLLGGPLGAGGRGLAGLARKVPVAGEALALVPRGVAAADDAYLKALSTGVDLAGKGLTEGVKRLPGGQWAMEQSNRSKLAQWVRGFGRSVNEAEDAGVLGKAFGTEDQLALRYGRRMWSQLGERWGDISQQVRTMAPVDQAAVLDQWRAGAGIKNSIEAREAATRATLQDELGANHVTPDEFRREMADSYRRQGEAVYSVQEALYKTIDDLRVRGAGLPPGTAQVPPTAAAGLSDLLGKMEDPQLAARHMAELLQGTGMAPNVIGSAEDTIYRQARKMLVDEVEAAIPGLRTEFESAGLAGDFDAAMDAARTSFNTVIEDLGHYGKAPEEILGGLDEGKRKFLIENEESVRRSLTRLFAARRSVQRIAEPLLNDWYREHGVLDATQRAEAVGTALGDMRTLLAHPALGQAGTRDAKGRIEAIARRFNGVGDPLASGQVGQIVTNLGAQMEGARLGIKSVPPWFGWAATGLASWKELALLSPRFHLTNLLGILTVSATGGVDPGAIITNLGRNLRTFGAHTATTGGGSVWEAPLHASTMPKYAAVRGTSEAETVQKNLGLRHQGEALVTGETTPTAVGRVPLALRAGVPGLATGAGVYQNLDEEDPNRLLKSVAAGIGGAAFGAAAPRLVATNMGLAGAIEGAARDTAFYTAFEKALPAEVRRFGDTTIQQVLTTPDVTQTIGKPLMIDTGTGRFAGVDVNAPSPQVVRGQGVDWQSVQAAFRAADGEMTPNRVRELAIDAGATEGQANALRAAWDSAVSRAEDSGVQLANRLNFDYSNVNNLVEFLRRSGIAPFVTWGSKALPLYASILAQHPQFILAIDTYNQVTEEEARDAGLPEKQVRFAKLGVLGDWLAGTVLGREGLVLGKPILSVAPQADLGSPPSPADTPIESTIRTLGQVGLGLGPVASVPLGLMGAVDLPPSLLRTSGYANAATAATLGVEADVERLPRTLMAQARAAATGQPVEPSITGDPFKDYQIRTRIKEIAVEETGRPASGAYLEAMDNPDSPIWERARYEVERQRTGQTVATATVPFPTTFVSPVSQQARAAQVAQGVAPEQVRGLSDTVRSQQFKQAIGRDPMVAALWGTGGSSEEVAKRQLAGWGAFWRRTARLPAAQRARMRSAYLEDKPELRRYLSEHPVI